MFLHYIAIAGLALSALGWALQYRHFARGKSDVAREFVGLNIIGFIMWAMDAAQTGMYDIALMYGVLLFVSMAVFFKTKD